MTSPCSPRAALGVMVFMAVAAGVVSAQSGPSLGALTVPTASLPEGCRLTPPALEPVPTPTPIPQPEGGVIAAVRTPFELGRFPGNPWIGADGRYIAQVRVAFERLPLVHLPDGPPLEHKEAAKLLTTQKGDMAEAYRASYQSAFSRLVLVQAVRYPDEKWATPGKGRIVRGSTVIVVGGNPQGECFKTVLDYIQSLK